MIKTYIDDKIMKKYFKERDVFLKNPYKPGAGTAPEFLAGRDKILEDVTNNLNELYDILNYDESAITDKEKQLIEIFNKYYYNSEG